MSDRGRTYAATVEPGCGCRLVLIGTRWVRITRCGGTDCRAKVGAQVARREQAFRVRATRSGPPPR